jgi:hypothetical protein
MDRKTAYQQAYADLFRLIVTSNWCDIQQEYHDRVTRMDALPGSDRDKTAWGLEVGALLYQRLVYG